MSRTVRTSLSILTLPHKLVSARFRPLLHEAIQQALREGADDIWTNSAIQIQQGWMHIHGAFHSRAACSMDLHTYTDSRHVPALGRIGDPDDIIASVLVKDSKVRYCVASLGVDLH